MTWVKLDDGFWMHPKILGAGNTATGIFARMLAYCGCYHTDGLVPTGVVPTIVGKDTRAFEALTQTGLITVLESGGVVIRDYLDYNRSREQVEADREQRVSAGRSSGRARQRGSES